MPAEARAVEFSMSVKHGASRLSELGVTFREFVEEDRNFIINSYMHGYWTTGIRETGRAGGFPVSLMDPEAYTVNQRAILLGLMASGVVIMACSAKDPWFVFGYLIGEVAEGAAVVHYVRVKKNYRQQGIAGALLGEMVTRAGNVGRVVFSHWAMPGGPVLVDWIKKRGLRPVWNRYSER